MAATLTEKVREILFEHEDRAPKRALDHVHARPDRMLEEHEYVSREWGFTYGLAYGIARSEDPDESNESVARRARHAADEMFDDSTFVALTWIRWAEDPQPSEAVA